LKQSIRAYFHPQLVKLWSEHPTLSPMMVPNRVSSAGPPHRTVDAIGRDYARGPNQFVPLVRVANELACRLDIQVLLRKEPYQVFSGHERGDLDNRIKTLIDGLRMPRQISEMGGVELTPEQNPQFCLLEDDKVVYEFSVKADQLLAGPTPGQTERDVVAIIGVHVTTNERHEIVMYSKGFGRL
jgi:hypothetical protein